MKNKLPSPTHSQNRFPEGANRKFANSATASLFTNRTTAPSFYCASICYALMS